MQTVLIMRSLLDDNNIPVHGCAYSPNRIDYNNATPGEIIIGDAILVGFEQATMDINAYTVTATCDVSDTDIVFDVWDANGVLQFRQTVAAVGGVADYTLDATPGLYTVRAYGTITYVSGFVEVTVI